MIRDIRRKIYREKVANQAIAEKHSQLISSASKDLPFDGQRNGYAVSIREIIGSLSKAIFVLTKR